MHIKVLTQYLAYNKQLLALFTIREYEEQLDWQISVPVKKKQMHAALPFSLITTTSPGQNA